MAHFNVVKANLEAKYGNNVRLVRDQSKIAFFQEMGCEQLEGVEAESSGGMNVYAVFVLQNKSTELHAPKTIIGKVSEKVAAKTVMEALVEGADIEPRLPAPKWQGAQ
jgi:hypothetical protein